MSLLKSHQCYTGAQSETMAFFFETLLTDILVMISVLAAAFYYWLTSTHNYWEKKKVPFVKPSFPFGNFTKSFTGSTSFDEDLNSMYHELKPHGFGGAFSVRTPIFVVCEPELIKQILTKDFSSFHDRGVPYDEENDPYSAHLFNLGGQRWKDLRAKLSPTFTSGKIKAMVPLISECTEELNGVIRAKMLKRNGSVEMHDLLVRFVTDVIGTCAFGVTCNCLKEHDAEFYKMSREVFNRSTKINIIVVLVALFPKLIKLISIKNLLGNTSEFFEQLMDRTVRHRKENNVTRNDFVDLMMKILDDEKNDLHFNQDAMVAQALLFFTAGLDNVSNTIGFSLHALALDPELQERVHDEITSVLKDFGGEMNYDALGKMNLVSRVIDETLRLHTPVGFLMRSQTEDNYKIPNTEVTIPKNTSVMIPIQAMHLDEEYFPNPDKFDPDRFTEEEKAKRHPYAYIPFGEGPRFCIASRFAQLEMRLCLADLVRHFRFSVAPETDLSLELDPTSLSRTPKNKFWLRVAVRETE